MMLMILMNRWNDYHQYQHHHPFVHHELYDLYDDLTRGAGMEVWWTKAGDLLCIMPSRKD